MIVSQEIVDKCLAKEGLEFQLNMMVEECAELIHAIQHAKRNRPHNIHEEIADVLIMADALRMMLDTKTIDKFIEAKLKRLVEERL